MALGAGRGRILAQTLTESIVLASAGAILGSGLAEFAVEAIRRFAADSLPRLADLQLDGTAFLAAVACVFGSTILSGLFSARIPDFQGGREMARRDRGRDALIVLQVALASVLLLVASLLSQSFLRLRAVNPGFDPDKVLIVRASLPASVQRATFIRHASEMLTRLPDVESAGATNVVPFSGEGTANRFRIGQESSLSDFHVASWRAVTPSFFSTLGVPLRRGRLFTDADANGALEVVIISESMARQFWPNQNPVGKTLLWGGSASPKVIVGVVGDLRDLAVDAHPVPTMFRPFAQLSDAPMTFVVRTNAEPTAAIADIRRGIWSLDRNVALEFKPLRDAMSDSLMRPRATLAAIAAFALMAILTAAFGLYGLISYRVNQRQQEIGIRLALGAPAASVRWSVQRRCLALVCAGSAIGLPLAFLLAGLIGSLLYETQPAQASAYLLVALVFVAVAFAASFGPARRASRMDPVAAIRYE
jgi:putative ABC transport system permease protein